jgi:hypothetical protein
LKHPVAQLNRTTCDRPDKLAPLCPQAGHKGGERSEHRPRNQGPAHSAYERLINQHTYGIPAAEAPAFCLCDPGGGEMAALYRDSFERVWSSSAQSHSDAVQRTATGEGDDSADAVERSRRVRISRQMLDFACICRATECGPGL